MNCKSYFFASPNLIVRFCPTVEIDVPAGVPFVSGANGLLCDDRYLGTALESLRTLVWGTTLDDRPTHSDADVVVSVGPPPRSVRTPCIRLSFGHWWGAATDDASGPLVGLVAAHAVGPLIAGCLGANSVFKALLRSYAERVPNLSNENTHWDLKPGAQCLSLLDYSLSSADLPSPVGGDLPFPVLFVSAGAICSAVGYGLRSLSLALPAATIFEPKLIDPPDLNRYLIAHAADLDRPKADVLAEFLRCRGPVVRKVERLSADTVFTDQHSVHVVGVDHVPSRWTAQALWPHSILIGATEYDELRVSVHSAPPNQAACARCLDPIDAPTRPGEVIPAISFVSALVGFAIVGELVKLTSPALAKYRLRNVAGGRLLQLSSRNWHVRFVDANPACVLCGGDLWNNESCRRSA